MKTLLLRFSLAFATIYISIYFFNVKAQEQFETQYSISYKIEKNGDTQVTQDILIINKLNDVLATNYILTVKQLNIYDVTASDDRGTLVSAVTNTSDETSIKIALRSQAIGEGKKNQIRLVYKSKQIANRVGEVWNINILPVTVSSSTTKYDVLVTVPQEFGPRIYISPQPESEDKNTLKFTKDQINSKSISASYGNYQVMNFKLDYELHNSAILPTYQEIALPPQIQDRQQVIYKNLEPKPHKIKTDKDGNLLAVYKLGPRQKLSIQLVGSVRTIGKQINPEDGSDIKSIPSNIVKDYTRAQKYWEVNSPEIQELAKQLFDPNKNSAQNAQNIYEYITKNLRYNFDVVKEDFVERRGALTALKDKESGWACMEFTDLFIAVSRAMGIPARELNGYAFSNADNITPLSINLKSGDLLHSWPEFYDQNLGWVAIDPTWGSTSGIDFFTKLDTNHFVFSIKGLNSEYPFPAGAYRADTNEKQVEVDFAQNPTFQNFKDQVQIKIQLPLNPIKYAKGFTRYKVINTGGTYLYNIAGTKLTLLPFTNEYVYIPNDVNVLSYMDFKGNAQEITWRLKD